MPPGFADVQVPGVVRTYSPKQEDVLEALREATEPLSARELADRADYSKEHVRQTLQQLVPDEESSRRSPLQTFEGRGRTARRSTPTRVSRTAASSTSAKSPTLPYGTPIRGRWRSTPLTTPTETSRRPRLGRRPRRPGHGRGRQPSTGGTHHQMTGANPPALQYDRPGRERQLSPKTNLMTESCRELLVPADLTLSVVQLRLWGFLTSAIGSSTGRTRPSSMSVGGAGRRPTPGRWSVRCAGRSRSPATRSSKRTRVARGGVRAPTSAPSL